MRCAGKAKGLKTRIRGRHEIAAAAGLIGTVRCLRPSGPAFPQVRWPCRRAVWAAAVRRRDRRMASSDHVDRFPLPRVAGADLPVTQRRGGPPDRLRPLGDQDVGGEDLPPRTGRRPRTGHRVGHVTGARRAAAPAGGWPLRRCSRPGCESAGSSSSCHPPRPADGAHLPRPAGWRPPASARDSRPGSRPRLEKQDVNSLYCQG